MNKYYKIFDGNIKFERPVIENEMYPFVLKILKVFFSFFKDDKRVNTDIADRVCNDIIEIVNYIEQSEDINEVFYKIVLEIVSDVIADNVKSFEVEDSVCRTFFDNNGYDEDNILVSKASINKECTMGVIKNLLLGDSNPLDKTTSLEEFFEVQKKEMLIEVFDHIIDIYNNQNHTLLTRVLMREVFNVIESGASIRDIDYFDEDQWIPYNTDADGRTLKFHNRCVNLIKKEGDDEYFFYMDTAEIGGYHVYFKGVTNEAITRLIEDIRMHEKMPKKFNDESHRVFELYTLRVNKLQEEILKIKDNIGDKHE